MACGCDFLFELLRIEWCSVAFEDHGFGVLVVVLFFCVVMDLLVSTCWNMLECDLLGT